jgi:predicted small lipoprotein YifL
MKTLLMTMLICLAFNASAACPVKRPGELPVLPDGAVASEEDVYRADLAAEQYLLQAQAYIDCGVMNRRQHRALTAQLEEFSQMYRENIELQVRTNIIAEK